MRARVNTIAWRRYAHRSTRDNVLHYEGIHDICTTNLYTEYTHCTATIVNVLAFIFSNAHSLFFIVFSVVEIWPHHCNILPTPSAEVAREIIIPQDVTTVSWLLVSKWVGGLFIVSECVLLCCSYAWNYYVFIADLVMWWKQSEAANHIHPQPHLLPPPW